MALRDTKPSAHPHNNCLHNRPLGCDCEECGNVLGPMCQDCFGKCHKCAQLNLTHNDPPILGQLKTFERRLDELENETAPLRIMWHTLATLTNEIAQLKARLEKLGTK